MHKNTVVLFFTLAVLSTGAHAAADPTNGYHTGYTGVVLGENTPRSATDVITRQATQEPGDIYRGTILGAEQQTYESTTLGNRPYATKKYVYDTSLVRAIKIGDADRVRTLIYAHVNANEKNYAGITPLTVAAEKGNMDIIKILVEDGHAKINDTSSYGVTPLIAAAAAGQAKAIEYLVERGADVTVKDDRGKTALLYAVNFDEPQAVESLIKVNNLAVNLPDNSGNTPLVYAAQKGFAGNVKALLAYGANPDYRNPSTGLSALAAAAAEGHTAVIRTLAKNGRADLDLPDLAGRTPLFYAVEQNKPEAVRTLILLGANPNAQDNNGATPLMYAAAKNRQECVTLLLKQKNVNPGLQDAQGRTALSYSAFAPDIFAAQKLVDANQDINTPDKLGNTPLMYAIKAKNDRTALFLIQQGADLTLSNQAGENAFTLADQYLPASATANVLSVKRAETQQQALQVQAQKLAEVRFLEQELAQQEAAVSQLQAAKAAELNELKTQKEAEVRQQLEQEYQQRTALLEQDPELQKLQQQLEEAKAQKQAALKQEMDRRLAEMNSGAAVN